MFEIKKHEMNKDKIIQKGDVAKYQIEIAHEDFDQLFNDFCVILHFGMDCGTRHISKKQMFHDEEGNWFFTFNTKDLPLGPVKAETRYWVPDSDMDGGLREEAEWTWIGFITDNPCPRFASHFRDACVPDHVTFRRTYRSDANTLYQDLLDVDNEYMKDSEEMQLKVRKPKSELK